MIRLSKEERLIRDKEIVAKWKLGTTQNDLVKIYGLSKGKINQLCKGVPQDLKPLVKQQIKINQKLTEINDQEVTAFKQEVINLEKALQLFQDSAMKGQKLANHIVTYVSKMYDEADDETKKELSGQAMFIAKEHSMTTARNKETVLGKTPDTAIQINNNRIVDDGSNEW